MAVAVQESKWPSHRLTCTVIVHIEISKNIAPWGFQGTFKKWQGSRRHCPYLPDITTADFFLCWRVKSELADISLSQNSFKTTSRGLSETWLKTSSLLLSTMDRTPRKVPPLWQWLGQIINQNIILEFKKWSVKLCHLAHLILITPSKAYIFYI